MMSILPIVAGLGFVSAPALASPPEGWWDVPWGSSSARLNKRIPDCGRIIPYARCTLKEPIAGKNLDAFFLIEDDKFLGVDLYAKFQTSDEARAWVTEVSSLLVEKYGKPQSGLCADHKGMALARATCTWVTPGGTEIVLDWDSRSSNSLGDSLSAKLVYASSGWREALRRAGEETARGREMKKI